MDFPVPTGARLMQVHNLCVPKNLVIVVHRSMKTIQRVDTNAGWRRITIPMHIGSWAGAKRFADIRFR
jgi:hypothetical protein